MDLGAYERPNATINLSGGGNFRLTLNDTSIELYDEPGTLIFSVEKERIAALIITGADNVDDTLTLDFSDGNPIPGGGLSFHGGSGGTDALALHNGTFTTVTHSFVNASDGSVDLDGTAITYTGLEPVDDTLSATDRVFSFTGDVETITLGDDGEASDVESRIDSTLGESVTFAHPSQSLTVHTTSGSGADVVEVAALDSLFAAALTVEADSDETVNINANPAPGGLKALAVAANAIHLNVPIENTGAQSYTGVVSLGDNVTLTSNNGSVFFSSTIDGTGALTVTSGSGAVTLGNVGTVTPLTGLTVNNSSGAGAITLSNIGSSGAAGVSGATSIGNAATTLMTLNGTAYHTGGNQGWRVNSGGNFNLNAGSTTTFTSTAGEMIFGNGSGPINLADGSHLVTNAGNGTYIRADIQGTSDETVLIQGNNRATALHNVGNSKILAGLLYPEHEPVTVPSTV